MSFKLTEVKLFWIEATCNDAKCNGTYHIIPDVSHGTYDLWRTSPQMALDDVGRGACRISPDLDVAVPVMNIHSFNHTCTKCGNGIKFAEVYPRLRYLKTKNDRG